MTQREGVDGTLGGGVGRGRGPDESREPSRGASRADGTASYDFLGLVTLVLRHRKLLVGLPLAAAVAAVILSLVLPSTYAAESVFMPESESAMPAEMAGLAEQLGITPPGESESVDFYVELLRSHELLRQVARTEYQFAVDDGRDTLRGSFLELMEIEGDTPLERLQNGVIQLRDDHMVAYVRRAASVVYLETLAPWPGLAEALNRRMLELVNTFNLERRRSRASEQRTFLEAQVAEAEADLRQAENELESFIAGNRRYADSPETRFQYQRLQRRVTFLEGIHTARAQALEQARLEAVRNTPVITVVDAPEGTALEDGMSLPVNALLAALLGFAIAVSYLILSELLRGARRSRPGEYHALVTATRETLDDFRPRSFLRSRRGEPGG